jgi:signal transduction histidine kinase
MAARLREMRKSNYWQMLMEKKKSDAVIDSIYEPVIVTDAQGHITKINRAGMQLFETPSRNGDNDDGDLSLTGFGPGEMILGAVRDAVALQKPVAAEGEAAIVPIKVGNEQKSFRLRTTPMRDTDGRLLGAVTVLEDITSIREVDRIKTDFISVASSKMREPLHALQMSLYSLTEKFTDEFDSDQLDLLYSARADAEQLDELMNDLLQLAEIESGARTLSPTPLRPVDSVRAVLEKFNAAAESKHIKLENSISPDCARIKADSKAIKQILGNLLSNAIRHTPRDGKILISAEERGKQVIFSVSDTGEGIPEHYLPNIFGRFVHVENSGSGGTGLGLAIVKRLVEVEGGQVGVVSRVGEGTTFTFSLPMNDTVNFNK